MIKIEEHDTHSVVRFFDETGDLEDLFIWSYSRRILSEIIKEARQIKREVKTCKPAAEVDRICRDYVYGRLHIEAIRISEERKR